MWKYSKSYNKKIKALKNENKRVSLYNSYIGKIGRFIEPIFKPLGFDWKIDIALLGALSAKEIFISQISVIYSVGGDSKDHVLQNDGTIQELKHQVLGHLVPTQF